MHSDGCGEHVGTTRKLAVSGSKSLCFIVSEAAPEEEKEQEMKKYAEPFPRFAYAVTW